jgi:hypothetical protein
MVFSGLSPACLAKDIIPTHRPGKSISLDPGKEKSPWHGEPCAALMEDAQTLSLFGREGL